MKRETGTAPVGTGAITVLTVLLVLCLCVFSALTLSTAQGDLSLSERNAQMVTAWYQADAEAARQYDAFAAGTDAELESRIPMTDTQCLYLHLSRTDQGEVAVLAWQMISDETAPTEEDQRLPVFTGEF